MAQLHKSIYSPLFISKGSRSVGFPHIYIKGTSFLRDQAKLCNYILRRKCFNWEDQSQAKRHSFQGYRIKKWWSTGLRVHSYSWALTASSPSSTSWALTASFPSYTSSCNIYTPYNRIYVLGKLRIWPDFFSSFGQFNGYDDACLRTSRGLIDKKKTEVDQIPPWPFRQNWGFQRSWTPKVYLIPG